MDAVRADHEVVAPRLAVARAREHFVALLLDPGDGDAHAHRRFPGRRGQKTEQFAAAELTDRTETVRDHAQLISVDDLSLAVGNGVVVHRLTRRDEGAESAETVQDAAAQGIEAEHVAGMVEVRRAIDQVRLHVPAAQQRPQGEASDTRADNQNAHIHSILDHGRKDQWRRVKADDFGLHPTELSRLPPSVSARRRRRPSISSDARAAPWASSRLRGPRLEVRLRNARQLLDEGDDRPDFLVGHLDKAEARHARHVDAVLDHPEQFRW